MSLVDRSGATLKRKHKINLALQGGGAHGAFTWGVIDRLLEEKRIEFGWISAASAGSVNAVALASGLAEGSAEKARETMYKVWHGVHKAGVPDLMRFNPFLNGISSQGSLAQVAALWSPYEFNPLGFDPLRRVLTEHIDFELIREKSPVELLISATHVRTGRARLFRRSEMTVEAVLASACLPTIHHAVEIEGHAYWDGGFSANPDLVNIAVESPVQDTLIVTLAPLTRDEHPTTARDISNHASRLAFNAPLLRDVEIIEAVRETAGSILPKGRLAPLARHRFHLIDAVPVTSGLSPETALKPDWNVITFLHGAGRSEAEKWLNGPYKCVGKSETINLAEHFFQPLKPQGPPRERVAVREAVLLKARS